MLKEDGKGRCPRKMFRKDARMERILFTAFEIGAMAESVEIFN